jgi:hypothetical protein
VPGILQFPICLTDRIAELSQRGREPIQTRAQRLQVLFFKRLTLIVQPILFHSRPKASEFNKITLQLALTVNRSAKFKSHRSPEPETESN